jgi:hypothetical protein
MIMTPFSYLGRTGFEPRDLPDSLTVNVEIATSHKQVMAAPFCILCNHDYHTNRCYTANYNNKIIKLYQWFCYLTCIIQQFLQSGGG